ncbi:MAG TPA: DMT family transporter [Rhizobiales bacterium]|nr:DMT family transporter [Hyphomicrobiales bacterium]
MIQAPIGTHVITRGRQPKRGHLAAIAFMCGAVTVFAMVAATAKYLVDVLAVPVAEVVWVRFLAHALMTTAVLGPMFVKYSVRSTKPAHQLVRGILVAATTALNFAGVKYLQLDQMVTIFFLTPLLVAALAGPLLGEWVGWRRLLAILTGFFGVLLVMRPGYGGIHWAVIYSLGAMICYALYNIHTRYMARHDSPEMNLFHTPLAGAVITAPFALAVWEWPQDWLTWALFGWIGLTGALGHWLLILAFKYAPAPVVAPFIYVGLLSMSALGYVIFGDVPTLWTLSGGIVVVASGLYLLARAHRDRNQTGTA